MNRRTKRDIIEALEDKINLKRANLKADLLKVELQAHGPGDSHFWRWMNGAGSRISWQKSANDEEKIATYCDHIMQEVQAIRDLNEALKEAKAITPDEDKTKEEVTNA